MLLRKKSYGKHRFFSYLIFIFLDTFINQLNELSHKSNNNDDDCGNSCCHGHPSVNLVYLLFISG